VFFCVFLRLNLCGLSFCGTEVSVAHFADRNITFAFADPLAKPLRHANGSLVIELTAAGLPVTRLLR